MNTYTVKTNTRTLGLFATYMEASARCDQHYAATGESAWVVTNETPAAPVKTFAAPACH